MRRKIFSLIFMLAAVSVLPTSGFAESLGTRLSGRLLLQVQQRGEIWYVSPNDQKRYFVGGDALNFFRSHALGITNADLNKIVIAHDSLSPDMDSDDDGYSDRMEAQNNFDPFSRGKIMKDAALTKRLIGRLLLQVEYRGQVWYVDQAGMRWLVTAHNHLNLFRKNALGITDANLYSIPEGGFVLLPVLNQIYLRNFEKQTTGTMVRVEAVDMDNLADVSFGFSVKTNLDGTTTGVTRTPVRFNCEGLTCFDDAFRICKPGIVMVNILPKSLTETADLVRYEIVEKRADFCAVKVTELESLYGEEFRNKSMVCDLSNLSYIFDDAMYTDTRDVKKYSNCLGDLKTLLLNKGY